MTALSGFFIKDLQHQTVFCKKKMSPRDRHIDNIENFISDVEENNFIPEFIINETITLDDVDELLNELEQKGFHTMMDVPIVTNRLRYWYEQL